MFGTIGTLAKQLRYRWKSRHARPAYRRPRPWKRKAKGHKPGWGETYYGYSHPSEMPPRGSLEGPYDNNRPRGLAGLIAEAILRRLARRKT
jgi:hypothetical protein